MAEAMCWGGPIDGKRVSVMGAVLHVQISRGDSKIPFGSDPIPAAAAETLLDLPVGSIPLGDDEHLEFAVYRLDAVFSEPMYVYQGTERR